nr:hypothetical protein [Tanacetum cinerariifolium]
MDSPSPQVVSAVKLPILNPNEFDIWKIRIEQYFLMTDYSMWEVILNGDSPVPTRIIESVLQPVAPTTVEQRLARKNELKAPGRNLGANGPTSMGFDMSKVECYNCHRKGHFARECRSSKDPRRPGSYDWSYQVEEEPTNFALIAFSNSSSDNKVPSCSKACSRAYTQLHTQYVKLTDDFHKSQFDVISYHIGLESVEARLLVYKQNEFQTSGGYHAVPPPYTRTFMPPKLDLVFNTAPTADWLSDSETKSEPKAPQFVPSFAHFSKQVKSPRHSVQLIETTIPAGTSAPSKPVSNTAIRPVTAALPNITVTRPRHAHHVVTKFKSLIRRHTTRSPTSKTSNLPPRVTAVQAPVGNPQQALRDKGVIDSGCTRHMTENMSYLSEFEELNGGYVAFGGNPKGGKITSKGKIKTALELMLPWILKKNTKRFNAAGEELSVVMHKLMLLDTAAERRLMLLSQDKTVNENCCC